VFPVYIGARELRSEGDCKTVQRKSQLLRLSM
jgi:hypothetical protein